MHHRISSYQLVGGSGDDWPMYGHYEDPILSTLPTFVHLDSSYANAADHLPSLPHITPMPACILSRYQFVGGSGDDWWMHGECEDKMLPLVRTLTQQWAPDVDLRPSPTKPRCFYAS